MYYNVVTGRIESSLDLEDLVFPVTNEIVDSLFSKMVDHVMDGTLEDFIDSYDGTREEAYDAYLDLLKRGEI
jgi:hypothetical protein